MTQILKIDQVNVENAMRVENLRQTPFHKRMFLDIPAAKFAEYVKIKGELIFREKGEDRRFCIDEHNRENINQIYYYLTGSNKFNGDLKKGLWLHSKTSGTGKTTMLEMICALINDLKGRKIEITLSKDLAKKIENFGYEYFEKRILFIDDFGREQKELNVYGNKTLPVPEIIFRREKIGAWTFATSQRDIEGLSNEYSHVVIRRMKKMFNEIEFKGPNRNK